MIILAVSGSAKRGAAFEEFIRILLSKLGYRIDNVRIRRAGRELDVQATDKVSDSPLIAECKALSSLATGPDLSKFYGIYDHEYRKAASKPTGLMISLSGYNSGATDCYREKPASVRKRFKIYGPAEITGFAVDADLIVDDATVRHLASRSWPLELGATHLVITQPQLYRVQQLNRDGKPSHFIVYRAKGEDPTESEIEFVQKSVKELKKLEPLNLSARKSILLALTITEQPVSVESLSRLARQSCATVEAELDHLQQRRLVQLDNQGCSMLIEDLAAFCEVAKELLRTSDRYHFLLSRYFRILNDGGLAEYCLGRRHLESTPLNLKQVLTTLFNYSPSVLDQALFGDTRTYQVTYDHSLRLDTHKAEAAIMGIRGFFTELVPNLLQDLHSAENECIRKLPPVVGIREDYYIALGTSGFRLFDLRVDGLTMMLRATGPIQAGQLVSIDEQGRFGTAMTAFYLSDDLECLKEAEDAYNAIRDQGVNQHELAMMANNLACAYMSKGEYSEAQRWVEEGLKSDPGIPQLHGNLAIVLSALGDKEGAESALKEAEQLDPEYAASVRTRMEN